MSIQKEITSQLPFGICFRYAWIGILLLVVCAQSWGLGGGDPIHHSADRTLWDRKKNKIELIGHAAVHQPNETVQADRILLDLEDRLLDAHGNVVYTSSDTVIYAEEMHFHLDTRAGTIIGGRVLNSQFTLQGERINKLGDARFQTHWGEYTTCRDCPGSWSLLSEDVDLIFGSYGFFKNITLKVKDTPSIWLPYLIVPIKTKRQTGFLFPRIGYSVNAGFMGLLPFFWAPHRSFDLTLGAGFYSTRGFRGESEFRYALGPASEATVNFNYLNDNSGQQTSAHRWALNISQSQKLPWGFVQKLRVNEWSDNLYQYSGATDAVSGEMNLQSSVSLMQSSFIGGSYLSLTRNRNLLNSDPSLTAEERQWKLDSRTVQVAPRAAFSSNDWLVFGAPVAAGISISLDNFTRESGNYDSFSGVSGAPYNWGVDPLRKARRVSLFPRLYTSIRPFDLFSLTPSLEYRVLYYDFAPQAPSLLRAYPIFQMDFYTQIEKIFERPESTSYPRMKHLIRPQLLYSYIPQPLVTEDPSHPFMQQINRGISGMNFDSMDIVPIFSTPNVRNYFVPIGHSLTYGARTQWILRSNSVQESEGVYSRLMEVYFNHALNFLDPMSALYTRFNSGLDFSLGPLSYGINYSYTPPGQNTPFHTVSLSASYVIERSVRHQIMAFDRSFGVSFVNDGSSSARNIGLNAVFSVNDSIMPRASLVYDLNSFTFQNISGGLVFQSLSRCWRLGVSAQYNPVNQFMGPIVDFTMNLTGGGYSGLESTASQFVNR